MADLSDDARYIAAASNAPRKVGYCDRVLLMGFLFFFLSRLRLLRRREKIRLVVFLWSQMLFELSGYSSHSIFECIRIHSNVDYLLYTEFIILYIFKIVFFYN